MKVPVTALVAVVLLGMHIRRKDLPQKNAELQRAFGEIVSVVRVVSGLFC